MAGFDLTGASELFKTKYGKLSENTYNSANVLLARIKKNHDFVGKNKVMASPTSFAGGVGSGSLPTANTNNVVDPTITAKKLYARALIDREAIKAASSDEGSFVRATKWVVQRAVESYMRNISRMLSVDGSVANQNGMVAKGAGATNVSGTGTSGDPYVVVLNADTVESFVEEKDYLNYDSETSLLEVVSYAPATKTITLVGTSVGLAALTGVGPMLSTVYLYMQGSRDNDITGIGHILGATSGSLYGVPVARRWQASTQADAGAAGITIDMMNEDVLEIDRKCGKCPNIITVSYKQFRKILNLMEDHKYYNVDPRSSELKGKISFKGLEFMSSAGPVPIFADRFCPDDEIRYLNDNYISIEHRPGHGWMDDDGTIFMRVQDSDEYEARYGGYCELYSIPVYHGRRYNLA